MCPTSLEHDCVCAVVGKDPQQCDLHRTEPVAVGAK
jgi:hypothetical protein